MTMLPRQRQRVRMVLFCWPLLPTLRVVIPDTVHTVLLAMLVSDATLH